MKFSLKFNKNDIFLFVFLFLCIISLIIGVIPLNSTKADTVVIKYQNQVVHKMDINKDEVFVLYSKDYPDLNSDVEITVRDGKVAITKNDCPTKECMKMGWISSRANSIICATNNIVIFLETLHSTTDCDGGVC